MMCDKSEIIVVILKSPFLLEEQKRRILRAIVRMVGLVVYVGLGAWSEDA